MFNYPYIIELLSPRRDAGEKLEHLLSRFADKYERAISSGCGVSVPDNPMGQRRLSLLECLEERGLSVDPERVIMNVNTFHTKPELDGILKKAIQLGIRYLLVIRGDGGPDLPTLEPSSIGGKYKIATTHDLLLYINREYPGFFETGAAFNPYKKMSFEFKHLQKKIDSGCRFIITQPIIGRDENVDAIQKYNLPVIAEAWMSLNIELFSKSVGMGEDNSLKIYDPMENLKGLHIAYPGACIYLALYDFKTELPYLRLT